MSRLVVILAAGVGRRLGISDDLPKWLAPVAATTPAALQLEACARSPEVAGVVVVTGHGNSAVEVVAQEWVATVPIELVANPHFRDRNNWYSLLVGLRAVGGRTDDGVYVLNSDLCASVGWFVDLFTRLEAEPASGAVAVDFDRVLTDEAMLVSVDGSHLDRIAKVGVDRPVGEYVGLTLLRAAHAEGLADVLGSFVEDPLRVDAWYEHGIQAHVDAGASYRAVAVPDGQWVEIDTAEDLAIGSRLMAAGPEQAAGRAGSGRGVAE